MKADRSAWGDDSARRRAMLLAGVPLHRFMVLGARSATVHGADPRSSDTIRTIPVQPLMRPPCVSAGPRLAQWRPKEADSTARGAPVETEPGGRITAVDTASTGSFGVKECVFRVLTVDPSRLYLVFPGGRQPGQTLIDNRV